MITIVTIPFIYPFMGPAVISWRPDPLSIFIGLGLGVVAAFIVLQAIRSMNRQSSPAPEEPPPLQARWERSELEKRYHAAVSEHATTMHLARGVAPLDQLFVPPPILGPVAPPHPQKPPPLATTQLAHLWPELAARVATPPLPTISVRHLLQNGRRVILSAPSGAGKSALLAYCAYLCAQAKPGSDYAFLQRHIPVLIHAADLRLGPDDDTAETIPPILRALQTTMTGLGPLMEHKAESGQILLLLDGWEEITAESRAYTLSWLRRFLARYIGASVFVATGTRGFEPLLDLDFTLSGLGPWHAAQAHELGQRWAAALQASEPPPLDQFWRPQQTVLESTLRLWAHYVEISLEEDHLPALLHAAISHFAAESATSELSAGDFSGFWQSLADASLQHADVELSQALIDEIVKKTTWEHVSAADSDERRAALSLSLEQVSIFAPAASNSWRWASPLWRDHLAAVQVSRMVNRPDLRNVLRDPPRSGMLLQLAYLDPVAIVDLANWLLDKGSLGPYYEDLFRIASWLSVSKDDGNWRQQTLIRLGQIISGPEAADIQRLRAIATLPDCNSPGILPLLRQLLQRSDPVIRQAAVAAIARFEPEESIPALKGMLQDDNADVRVAVVHALGWIPHESAHEQLLRSLIGNDDLMRYAAVDVLARGGPEDLRALQEATVDEDERVRRAAARGLAAIDDAWADELLQRMETNDEQWLVRASAGRVREHRLQRQRQRPWYPICAANLAWVVQWSAKRDQTVPGGAAAVTLLCEMLSTAREPAIRYAAARTLAYVTIPVEERTAVCASLWQATRSDASGAVREAAHATMAFLQRVRGT